jgi:RNA-directed DNA polymerase
MVSFDNISHTFLLNTLGQFPARKLIQQWLKAGYVNKGAFHNSESGTPQGGVISPLLANIALHGMEQALGVQYNRRGYSIGSRAVIRYADDFVVFCESQDDAQKAIEILIAWLQERGLELSPDKTKIVHLSEGFDFLGFNRHYRAEKTSKTGYKLLIKPSHDSLNKIRKKLRDEWVALRGHSIPTVIQYLNPIIRGWANYFRIGVARKCFESLDNWMFRRQVRYVEHTHPNKPKAWTQLHYWGKLNLQRNDRWVFGDRTTGMHLLKFSWFSIDRHVLVKGKASPDDPTLRDYWKAREQAKVKALTPSYQTLAKRQRYACLTCGASLFNGEDLHVHHVKPRVKGGKDAYSNLRLLHLYCHQQHHATTSKAVE